jgi:penicillin-insensitive murein endopeptidase
VLAAALLAQATAAAAQSTCFGTISKGRLENGVALPGSGRNFTSYSSAA